MFLPQQQFWIDLLNRRRKADDDDLLDGIIPAEKRDFTDPPGWPRRKTVTYLGNHLDMLLAAYRAVEDGKPPDFAALNLLLADGECVLTPEGPETLVPRSRDRGGNPGSLSVRDLLARAAFFFAEYVDYRRADPAYPDASPDRFQVRECLRADCGRLFPRTPRQTIYCSEACAGRDAAGGEA